MSAGTQHALNFASAELKVCRQVALAAVSQTGPPAVAPPTGLYCCTAAPPRQRAY
eukprot:COSAG01_NODE_1899_length_8965_cov_3.885969_5_plen_55_part_00